jgi:hypothetical protein
MLENSNLRDHLTGIHKNFLTYLNEKQLIKSLQYCVGEISVAGKHHIPTDEKYKKEILTLTERFIKLRDDESAKDNKYLEKLRELASDFVKFEFKVEQETE